MTTDDRATWLPGDGEREPPDAPGGFQQVGVIGGAEVQPVRPPRRRPRWLLPAIAGVALVLVASIIGVWALAGTLTGSGVDAARAGYAYLPDSATVVAEMRLDLPAGQKEQLGTFLSRFPGFDDPSTVERQLVDALDQLVRSMSSGLASYRDDIQPFFSGWAIAGGSLDYSRPADATMVALFGVSDRDAAERAMLKFRPATLTWIVEDVDGVQLWSGQWRDQGPFDFDLGGQAYAVTDDVLIFAQRADDVRTALDTRAGRGVALLDQPRFADALRRLPAGRLGMYWVDLKGAGILSRPGSVTANLGPECAATANSYPEDALGVVYLRDGRALVDLSYSLPPGAAPMTNSDSVLDDRLPADTFLFAEGKEVGTAVRNALDCARSLPQVGDQLERIERSVGKIDNLVGWAGDAAIGARFDGTRVTAGLVVRVNDQLAASEAMGQLRAALTALNEQLGGVTVTEETYRDARLVTFELTGEGLSGLPEILPQRSLAYALKGDLLVIGVDASFARAVLDTDAANSLATRQSYRRALDFAGAGHNSGVFYVDVPVAVQLAEAIEGAPAGAGGLGTIRGYVDALDDGLVAYLADQNVITVRLTINTRETD